MASYLTAKSNHQIAQATVNAYFFHYILIFLFSGSRRVKQYQLDNELHTISELSSNLMQQVLSDSLARDFGILTRAWMASMSLVDFLHR